MRRVPAHAPVQYTYVKRVTVTHETPTATPEPELSPELLTLIERAAPGARTELLAPVLFKFDSAALEAIGVAMLHEVARELAHAVCAMDFSDDMDNNSLRSFE